jgi:hypothetical protein
MNRQEVLDLYFMDARSKLIDIAAFLDRVDRAEGEPDFRLAAFREALKELAGDQPTRAKKILLSLSDPTTEPIAAAPGKGAVGAWPGEGGQG